MTKQTEAMKLALEALDVLLTEPIAHKAADRAEYLLLQAAPAIREALAEQETVLPGGGHVPAVPVAVYGYCPECGGAGVMRERRPNGDDKCTNGHKYPSSKALAEQPAQQKRGVWPCVIAEADFEHDTITLEMQCSDYKVGAGQHWLSTSPPAQRKPLTDEQVNLFINGRGDEGDDDYVEPTGDGFGLTDADLVHLVRRVEAAHGIKGDA